jgi:hypothetical protein
VSASVGFGAVAPGSSAACGDAGMCVCAHRRTQGARGKVPKGWPRLERDVAAAVRGCRARRGRGRGMAWHDSARGTGAHARARILASQGHGVAVPCEGHRHPGPTARRGSVEVTAAAGKTGGATGLVQKRWHSGRMERGSPKAGYRGLIDGAGSRGEGKERAAAVLIEGSQAGDPNRWRAGAGGSELCRTRSFVGVVVRGAGLGELRCGDGLLLALLFSSTPFFSSSAGAATAGRGKTEAAGFWGSGLGVLKGAALGFAARARTPKAAMPGVRATATRRASGGCGAGLGFAARAAGAREGGGEGARAVVWLYCGAGGARGIGTGSCAALLWSGWCARDRPVMRAGAEALGKEERRLRPSVARRGEWRRGQSEPGEGVSGGRRES